MSATTKKDMVGKKKIEETKRRTINSFYLTFSELFSLQKNESAEIAETSDFTFLFFACKSDAVNVLLLTHKTNRESNRAKKLQVIKIYFCDFLRQPATSILILICVYINIFEILKCLPFYKSSNFCSTL